MNKQGIIDVFERTYKNDGFPPLAGKVVGFFYVTDTKYIGFQDIVKGVGASKGAVSKVLKILIGLYRINSIDHPNDNRKRLYYLDTENLIKFLEIVINNYREQSDLLHAVLKIRTEENQEMNDFIERSIAFNDEMLNFLDEKSKKYFT
ncbi:hypothetical protein [uncultured Dokdonia sp.]|uniref:GbsR/MarR family transcriptional regulator n=1 Tax=uncultured Dokdonia sp. TaxID=575653 RepID=UPI002607B01D|nr:hypothetical protein [uncultured Dokdonia sp.]